MPRVDPRGPLGGPLGGSEDRKDVKTKSANWRRNSLALEKGRIKHSEKYRAPQGMTNTMKKTKKLSGYAGWWKISNWREEIGASERIRTTEKEGMIMSMIAMMKNPAKLAPTKGRIIPGNHTDKEPEGVTPMKSFSLLGIEATKTPLTFIRTCWPRLRLPRGWKALQCGHGCDEPSPAQSCSVAILGGDWASIDVE